MNRSAGRPLVGHPIDPRLDHRVIDARTIPRLMAASREVQIGAQRCDPVRVDRKRPASCSTLPLIDIRLIAHLFTLRD